MSGGNHTTARDAAADGAAARLVQLSSRRLPEPQGTGAPRSPKGMVLATGPADRWWFSSRTASLHSCECVLAPGHWGARWRRSPPSWPPAGG